MSTRNKNTMKNSPTCSPSSLGWTLEPSELMGTEVFESRWPQRVTMVDGISHRPSERWMAIYHGYPPSPKVAGWKILPKWRMEYDGIKGKSCRNDGIVQPWPWLLEAIGDIFPSIAGWWFNPSENLVSWEYSSQYIYMWKNKKCSKPPTRWGWIVFFWENWNRKAPHFF